MRSRIPVCWPQQASPNMPHSTALRVLLLQVRLSPTSCVTGFSKKNSWGSRKPRKPSTFMRTSVNIDSHPLDLELFAKFLDLGRKTLGQCIEPAAQFPGDAIGPTSRSDLSEVHQQRPPALLVSGRTLQPC